MAKSAKENRIVINLACQECKERNYVTEKNRRNDPDRLEFRKYCRVAAHRACIARRARREAASRVGYTSN